MIYVIMYVIKYVLCMTYVIMYVIKYVLCMTYVIMYVIKYVLCMTYVIIYVCSRPVVGPGALPWLVRGNSPAGYYWSTVIDNICYVYVYMYVCMSCSMHVCI